MSYSIQPNPQFSLQTQEQRQMGMFLHLSQLANVVLFPVGIVLPIVLWQTQKDKIPGFDAHGKMVVNWMISVTIYTFASIVLMFVLVGFLTIIAVALMGIVFPIIGAIKANNGEFWEYPVTIRFIK
ncbi:MAG: DUF4870 domain-containing protein [Pyrinomonadaceae bacterium]